MRINFLGLQAFLSVADRGSFRRAASHLHLSQTAVSHRIKNIERELGLKLFVRTTREISLTKAGLDLIETAREAVTNLEQSLEALRRQGSGRKRRLSIACLPAFAIYRLPPVLNRFKTLHPNVEVKIHDVSALELANLLVRDEAEFGLSLVSVNRWDLDVEPLIKADPIVIACRTDHELARKKLVRWADLDGVPLVRFGMNTSVRPLIDDALARMHGKLDWRYEVQRVETALALTEAGCALTVVPRSNVDLYGSRNLTSRRLRAPGITCAFGLVTKRGVPLSPIAEQFRDLLREQIAVEQSRGRAVRHQASRMASMA
jgi:DNA-binding transcriptional LysR family regulator